MPKKIIIIAGKPVAKRRPRFAKRGKFVKVYSAQETEEGRALWEIKEQWASSPLDCPIRLFITALFPITKVSIKKVEKMLAGEIQHEKKPDLDNIIKFYSDVCNGTVWRDDSLVYKIDAVKAYAKVPQIIIGIEWDNQNEDDKFAFLFKK